MKLAYLECATGISGDMTLAALLDAGIDEQAIQAGIRSLKLPGVRLHVTDVMQGCFRAKSVRMEHPPQNAHRHLSEITTLIEQADALTPPQRQRALEIFRVIGEAEARVHGTNVESIHFHEVGAIDSIVDIVGAAIGFDLLQADQVICGPIPTGRGQVRIDHGICEVPAPGTAELLKGIPLKELPISAELTTPTGAAIVRVNADRFGTLPAMTIEQIGCGAGTLQLPERANILRIFVGRSATAAGTDEVCLLETNIDDTSAEVMGYTKQKLLAAGALDVYSLPLQMKKDRPGTMLCVLSAPERAYVMEQILFEETGTLGIRKQILQRATRARQVHTVLTEYGAVLGKVAWQLSGNAEFSPEFEACAQLATATGRPLRTIYRAALTAFETGQAGSPPFNTFTGNSSPSPVHDHDHDHDHDQGDQEHGNRHEHDHGP